MHSSEEDHKGFVIRIPWDSNTVRGFLCSILFIALCVGISPYIDVSAPKLQRQDSTSIPIAILNLRFGEGDAKGKSHGNLQKEGAAAKEQVKSPRFDDAIAPRHGLKNASSRSQSSTELSQSLKPTKAIVDKKEIAKSGKADENTSTKPTVVADNSGSISKGEKKGSDEGTGKGLIGSGSGSGFGWNIDWGGGGGNVLVLSKSIPKSPNGLNNSTIVKLRFVVDKNGNVESVFPITRGAPLAESAAQRAMLLWKFKVKNEQRAEGVIKFTFDVN